MKFNEFFSLPSLYDSRSISKCPWCGWGIFRDEDYIYSQELEHPIHMTCYVQRLEVKLHEKDGL